MIVDAIFGTGLAKEVGGPEAAVIEEINRSGTPVIAIDIPSGLDGDDGAFPSGSRCGRPIRTLTALPMLGQLLHPGVTYRGKLTVVDISLPVGGGRCARHRRGHCGRRDAAALFSGAGRRRRTRACSGSVAVIAGSVGKTGAAVMATTAALKIGAGLVTLVVPASLNAIVAAKLTEAMTYPVDDGGKGFFTSARPTSE